MNCKVQRVVAASGEVGEVFAVHHEWRQRFVSYQSPQHGDAVLMPEGYFCIFCLKEQAS